jgi:hypothetical protein
MAMVFLFGCSAKQQLDFSNAVGKLNDSIEDVQSNLDWVQGVLITIGAAATGAGGLGFWGKKKKKGTGNG